MNARQFRIPKEWIAIGSLLFTLAVAWTTLRHDVDNSVREARYEKDSINVQNRLDFDKMRLDSNDWRLTALERQQREYLRAICKAVRCTEPRP